MRIGHWTWIDMNDLSLILSIISTRYKRPLSCIILYLKIGSSHTFAMVFSRCIFQKTPLSLPSPSSPRAQCLGRLKDRQRTHEDIRIYSIMVYQRSFGLPRILWSSKVLLTVCAIDGWSALLDRWTKAIGASATSLPHVACLTFVSERIRTDSWHAVKWFASLLLNGFPWLSSCSFIFSRDLPSKLGLKEPKEQRPPEDGAGRRRWQSK